MTPPSAATAHSRPRVRRGTAGGRDSIPRRVSGPARRPRAVAAPAGGGGALAIPRIPRLAIPGIVKRLPDARIVDRLLTGRLWIGIVAFALIGIVFMQVSLLRINAGIGRDVEQAQSLERINSDLRAQVSELDSNDRIQQVAERLGLELPPPGAVTFLGKDGVRMGGDAVTALAIGTQTGPAAANTSAGATVAGAASPAPLNPATGATSPSSSATTAQTASPSTSAATSTSVTPTSQATTPAPTQTQQQPATTAQPQAAASPQQQSAPTTAAGGATSPQG